MSWKELAKATRDARRVTDKLHETIKEAPDRLSLSVLNGALLVLLKNQVTLMESITELAGTVESLQESQQQWLAKQNSNTESISSSNGRPKIQVKVQGKQKAKDYIASLFDVGTEDDLEILPEEERDFDFQSADDSQEADAERDPAPEKTETASQNEGEAAAKVVTHAPTRVAPEIQTRIAIKSFDKRDNDFDKGLSLLNSWVSGPTTGTPFQIRKEADYAYLNVTGLSQEKIEERAAQVNKFFGFSILVGQMVYDGLVGEIWLYTR